MKNQEFKEVGDIPEYQYFHAYQSEEWGIALWRVIFGFRIRIWKLSNKETVEADLCFGADLEKIDLGFRTLLAYLEDGNSVDHIPHQTAKPYPNPCGFTEWLNIQVSKYSESEKGRVSHMVLKEGIIKSLSGFITNEHRE